MDQRRNLEIISYKGPPKPDGLHYGWSEFRMIDDLMDTSTHLSGRFIKITGRYIYPRIDAYCKFLDSGVVFSIDSKNRPAIPFVIKNPARSCKAGIFFSEVDFYNFNIRKLYQEMRLEPRKTHIEDIIFDRLIDYHGKNGISLRFPVEVSPRGVGGNGQNLGSPRKVMESYVRASCRRFFPWFWL